MINLAEIVERYKDKGLGYIQWGGKSYHEVNSDTPVFLNSYGGSKGFVMNELGQVQCFDLNDKVLVEREYYADEDLYNKVDYVTPYFWDNMAPREWWGLTLDNYYPWPYYPDREIKSFTVVRELPLFDLGGEYEIDSEGTVRSEEDFEIAYFPEQCLKYPEFFKPNYL